MNFTREPIVETVITPKEGFKLSIRNSRGSNLEEYSVDAVEVVSFGNSYFFRNREKPKAFILPLSEYEVLETKETRTILKTTQVEKSIKIGEQSKATTRTQEKKTSSKKEPKKTQRKRAVKIKKEEDNTQSAEPEKEPSKDEGEPQTSNRRTLLPPPTSLISEQINRYKDYLIAQEPGLEKEIPLEKEDTAKKVDLPPKEEEISYGEPESKDDEGKKLEEAEKVVDISPSLPQGTEE